MHQRADKALDVGFLFWTKWRAQQVLNAQGAERKVIVLRGVVLAVVGFDLLGLAPVLNAQPRHGLDRVRIAGRCHHHLGAAGVHVDAGNDGVAAYLACALVDQVKRQVSALLCIAYRTVELPLLVRPGNAVALAAKGAAVFILVAVRVFKHQQRWCIGGFKVP